MIRAYRWRARLETEPNLTIEMLGRQEKLSPTYLLRLLPLAFLAPDLTEAVLDGSQPQGLTVDGLKLSAMPLDWDAQRRELATA